MATVESMEETIAALQKQLNELKRQKQRTQSPRRSPRGRRQSPPRGRRQSPPRGRRQSPRQQELADHESCLLETTPPMHDDDSNDDEDTTMSTTKNANVVAAAKR